MIYPLVHELAVTGTPVTVTCRVLKIARAPFYRWKQQPVGEATWVRAHRVNALKKAHREDPEFGYRFLANEARKAGWRMSGRTVWKLCSDAGITSAAQRRRRIKNKKQGPPVFDDFVRRNFTTAAPNQVWLTDITEHGTAWIPEIVATVLFMRCPVKQPRARRMCPSQGFCRVVR
jgi:putative transposase